MSYTEGNTSEFSDAHGAFNRTYSAEAAITDAKFYRAHPEVLIDGQHAKRVINTLLTVIEEKAA